VEAPVATLETEIDAPHVDVTGEHGAEVALRVALVMPAARAEAMLDAVEVCPLEVEYVVPFTITETVPVSYVGPN
jgi:hypothetical protein